jgi:hypothetical protein
MKQYRIYLHASGIFKLTLSIRRIFLLYENALPHIPKNKEHEGWFLFRYVNH